MKNHPDRHELLNAVKAPSLEIIKHLKNCSECSELYEMFKLFQVAGKVELTDAPAHLIQKVQNLVGSKSTLLDLLKSKVVEIVFDSWENLAPASVRSSAVLDERRLQFKSESIMFDLRAERQKSKWEFTAQITPESETKNIKVVVGKNEYGINEFGLIQWDSKKPPLQLKLKEKDTIIELPKIHWNNK